MANNAIIEAAKVANQPQEDGLLKGFIQGIGALATGMLQRQEKAKKKAAVLDKAYSGKTDIKSVSDIVYITKQKVKDGDLTVEQGVEALQSFSYDVNKYLPEIDTLMKTFSASGFSNASDSKHTLLQNYVTSYTLGELNQPIKVNGKVMDAFIQTDASGNLTMMGANGEQVPFSEVAAELRGMVQTVDGDKGAKFMNNFLGSKFKFGTEGKFEESRDLLLSNLDKSMRDENSKMSMLFDNKYFAKGASHTFADHYMKTSMSEEERNEVNSELKKIKDPRAKEKAKSMLVIDIMKEDDNVEEDITSFYDNLIEMKRPVNPGSGPKIGSQFDPNINNASDYKLGRFSKAMNSVIANFADIKEDGIIATLQDYKIIFRKVKVGDPPKDQVQMFKLDGADNNKAIGLPFEPTQDGVIKNMPGVKAALGLADTKEELYAAENYKLYLNSKQGKQYLYNPNNFKDL